MFGYHSQYRLNPVISAKTKHEISIEAFLTLSPRELEEVFLIDVRSDEERTFLHIGGQHMPIELLREWKNQNKLQSKLLAYAIDLDTRIIIYCRAANRSYQAVLLLREAGFTNVKSLAGGMVAMHPEEYTKKCSCTIL